LASIEKRTLAQMIVVNRSRQRILLALHKSGRWQGAYTGFLGAVNSGEDPGSAAIRITREQARIVVPGCDHLATFEFKSEAWGIAREFEFLAEDHSGDPVETDTIRPEWFALDAIPYERMPADDALWYPDFLNRKTMQGHFNFAEDGKTLLSHFIEEVPTLV
jgi:ADP-ribose pyrophosphatase YjhB (NUDIX family)